MDIRELKYQVDALVDQTHDQEKFLVGVLAARVRQAAERFPTDLTLVNLNGILAKRASSNNPFITRAELKQYYTVSFKPENKFAVLFAEELGVKEAASPMKTMKHTAAEGKPLIDVSKLDSKLVSALNKVFDKEAIYVSYSAELAKSASDAVDFQLNCLGLPAKKVATLTGQEDLLICQASYETPKGLTYLIIPVEAKDNKAFLPSLFVSKAGVEDLTKDNLKNYLLENAGQNLKVNVKAVLEVMNEIKNGAKEELNEVEKIVIKASLAQKPRMIGGNLMYGEIEKEVSEYQLPKVAVPVELEQKSNGLSVKSDAAFLFGKAAVEQGRNYLIVNLRKLGYTTAQVSVCDYSKDGINYAVALDHRNGFKVPVKVEGGKLVEPKLVVGSNGVGTLTKEGIENVIGRGTDGRTVAMASGLYESKPSELLQVIKTAMENGEFATAEEALEILNQGQDKVAFNSGYALYLNGLKGEVKKEAAISKCAHQLKIRNSASLVCSQLNLPLNKVYQDQYGQCQPLYRKAMTETQEGVKFIHNKIHWD